MAGMVEEENCANAQELNDLIGAFLLDGGAAEDDDGCLALCTKLIEHLDAKSGGKKGGDENGHAGQLNGKLQAPVKMGELITGRDDGFVDPFLGMKKVAANTNVISNFQETLKLQKAQIRERDRQLKMMREWEKAKIPLPPPKRKHGDSQLAKLTDIIVQRFSVGIGGRELLQDSALKLVIGHKYGLVGRNGIGKSTFLNALARYDIHGVPHDVHILHIEQEIKAGPESALQSVLKVDLERHGLMEEQEALHEKEKAGGLTDAEGERLAWIFQRLTDIDAASAESRASEILAGLGFDPDMQKKPTQNFSGGWRMRVALARALFADPDILLLDEPTNHLDLHAVAWLTKYLQEWNKTCIIVSHARQFLNEVCTDIIHFAHEELSYYKGDYDNFEAVRAEKMKEAQRKQESVEAKRAHMQSFVDRFRYNAKRAALVQSRIKALSKLPMLEEITKDPSLVFSFPEPEPLPTPMLLLQNVFFRYGAREGDKPGAGKGKDKWLLRDVCISVDMESRIAVCGVNGSGKSTLLKLLTGQEDPQEGHLTRHNKLRIGFFSQHHVDTMDLTLNAVQQLQAKFPNDNLKDEDARNYLGKFGISGMLALEPLYVLSGGQKSRVSIALMAFNNPHILILDEPTNHLDLDAVQALICGLNEFKGGVVIVSHDAHMISCVCDEVWHVDTESREAKKYGGDFEDYRKRVLKGSLK